MTLEETAHFNKKELKKLYTEFRRICSRNGYLDMDGFRQSLGVLGMVQDSLLCQRLFSVFNKSKTGQISFEEYALSLGVLMKGTVDEKLDFAFTMTDIDGSGEITYEELMITVQSIMRIYSGIMGNNSIGTLDEKKVKRMFKQLDKNGDGMVTLDEYKRGMKRHPEFVTSLRGSDIYTNAQTRASEIQRKHIRRYQKTCILLEKQIDKAIELAEQIQGETETKILHTLEEDTQIQRLVTLSTKCSQNQNGVYHNQNSEKIIISLDETKVSVSRIGSEETLEAISSSEDSDFELHEKDNVNNKQGEEILEDVSTNGLHAQSKSLPITTDDGSGNHFTSKEELMFILKDLQAKLKEMSTDEFANERGENRKTRKMRTGKDKNMNTNNKNTKTADVNLPKTARASTGGESSTCEYHYGSDGHFGDTDDYETDAKSENKKDVTLDTYLASASTGSTVFFGHKNWDLVINVMKGIQMAVGRCSAEAMRPISVFDFGVKEKYTLIAGQKMHKNTRGHTSKDIDLDSRSCRFVDYAPFVFNKLREHFGIRNEDYVHSIGPGNMISNLMLGSLSSLSEQGSDGKSGSFFYITSDGLYMVKTLSREEHKQLRAILPQYFHHITSAGKSRRNPNRPAQPDTLLTWILGVHVIRLSKHSKIGADKIYLVVMNNILNTDLDLQVKYDLKGSWTGRKRSAAERQQAKVTLKDVDFTELQQKIRIGPQRKKQLMASIKRDCEFLENLQLIDYSLLLGIHRHSQKGTSVLTMPSISSLSSSSSLEAEKDSNGYAASLPIFRQQHGGMRSEDGKETYVMGIIDFLTIYSNRKKAERVLKTIQYFDNRGISVQPPKKYAQRFMDFLDKQIE
eukprot:CAMPEP_0204873176 /NCGR_PEP_ID=MMETSP1348-20121228/39927_1 /ASSEMBLY_ACC=CAM_ASM_000700 /TAXON_ID=215587 /ORGANISM="Aplanochytrium stocchinoi, Strain GSBS06" /LENGTH=853 /DNA_ID=CAMNT_0052028369 /DNA_START=186 /DNA_END=2747 /DNA_ORIENTATION=+